MKKALSSFILISFCIIIFVSPVAFAHSGRTDSNGGHNSADGYHYHHGYPAHQHINGTCPYDFDDKTGQNSGSSGGGSSSSKSSSSQSSIAHSQPKVEEKSFINIFTGIILCFIFITYPCSIGSIFLLLIIINELLTKNKIKPIPDYIFSISFAISIPIALIFEYIFLFNYEKEIFQVLIFLSVAGCLIYWYYLRKQEKEKQEQFERERQYYSDMYGGKSIEELVKIPDNLMIGDDNLPREKEATQYWGDSVTVFLTKDGSKYHRSGCRYGYYPHNIYKLTSYYSPCDVCKPPQIPDKSWYQKYLKIQGIKEKYNIK